MLDGRARHIPASSGIHRSRGFQLSYRRLSAVLRREAQTACKPILAALPAKPGDLSRTVRPYFVRKPVPVRSRCSARYRRASAAAQARHSSHVQPSRRYPFRVPCCHNSAAARIQAPQRRRSAGALSGYVGTRRPHLVHGTSARRGTGLLQSRGLFFCASGGSRSPMPWGALRDGGGGHPPWVLAGCCAAGCALCEFAWCGGRAAGASAGVGLVVEPSSRPRPRRRGGGPRGGAGDYVQAPRRPRGCSVGVSG